MINLILTLFQKIKFKFGLDRKRFVINYIRNNSISNILEIGVFNGNFAERMIRACHLNGKSNKINYYGIDLFSEMFDSSKYRSEVSLYPLSKMEVLSKLEKIDNVSVHLIQGDSNSILPKLTNLPKMDLIHIDGGHSFKTVNQDWLNVEQLMSNKTVTFFDDYTNKKGEVLGKFGINKVIYSINRSKYDICISKRKDFFWKEYGLLSLRMVRVRLK